MRSLVDMHRLAHHNANNSEVTCAPGRSSCSAVRNVVDRRGVADHSRARRWTLGHEFCKDTVAEQAAAFGKSYPHV